MLIRSLLTTFVAFCALVSVTAIVVAVSAFVLRPPPKDLLLLGLFLLASGAVTLAAGYAAVSLGLFRALRTLRARIVFVLLLTSALALVNVGFTARLMFISSHDLLLLAILLGFSLGMSALLAAGLSSSVHEAVGVLLQAIRRLGAGDLAARASVRSGDEVEEVARALNAMAEQLERASARQQELEQARRHLVAAASHDLRSPLASMRAMVESINDGVVTDHDTVRRYMHTLQAEIEYLSRLIDDPFELSQIDSGLLELHVERASLQDLISDTLESLSVQARRQGLILKGEVDEALQPVVMDSQRIQRVFYNLLQNAIRHTPADGTVMVRAVDTGQEVLVSVVDTGEGIPADEVPRLFERFHRVDKARSRTHGGSGLGLSLARGIVEAHGGRIWAESAPGQGATFTFTLPKPPAATPA